MRSSSTRRFAPLSLLLFLTLGIFAQAPPPKEPTAEQKTLLIEIQKWGQETGNLRQSGKPKEALAAAEKMLAAEIKLYGELHDDPIGSLVQIAELYEQIEAFDEAKKSRERVLRLQTERFGKDDWRVADAAIAAKNPDRLARLDAATRKEYAEVDTRYSLFLDEYQKGNFLKAAKIGEEVVGTVGRALGEDHPRYATRVSDVAIMYWMAGEYAKAEPLFLRALGIFVRTVGESHPDHNAALAGLAEIYRAMGEYRKAEPLMLRVRDHCKKTLGENHPDYASSLNNLAGLYYQAGEYAKAEPIYLRAMEIRAQVLGEDHPDFAVSLNNLAELYRDVGNAAKAESLVKQALEIRRKALGENHLDFATSLNNLAMLYQSLGEPVKADPLLRQAMEIRRKALGEESLAYADAINNLALVLEDRGDAAKAEPLLLQALGIYRKSLGENHPAITNSLNNLALLYRAKGEPKKAEPLLLQVREARKKTLGESHPDYALSLDHLAEFYRSTGDTAKAKPLYLEAVTRIADQVEKNSQGQSEAAQLLRSAAVRRYLDHLLAGTAGQSSEQVYDAVLRLRGSVTQRQVFLRSVRNAKPELAPLIEELQRTCSKLSRLATKPYDPDSKNSIPAEMQSLEEQRQRQETELAGKSDAFADYLKRRKLTAADLRKLLPEGGTLVEFLQYQDRFCAFILNRDRIVRVELGEVKPIEEAVDAFRDQLLGERPKPIGEKNDPRRVLDEKLWQPIATRFGKPKIILISPEGALCRLPFAALRASDPQKYLIEEFALVTVPVPALLPDLVAPRPAPQDSSTLLALGEVHFGSVPQGSNRGEIKSLPGTAAEVTSIVETFRKSNPNGQVTELRRGLAGEEWVRRGASRHTYLHFATHGFFAPAGYGQLLGDPAEERGLQFVARRQETSKPAPNPGLLSGLICAHANAPKELSSEDGVLTALEVQDLDLSRVEMVVLSACETGLGRTAGGEGVLGLQRAFHLAGAKTTVASLWKVDDEATRVLMTRFYQNLFTQKMSRLDALVEAQRWLMTEGPRNGFTRGLKLVPKKKEQPLNPPEKASPYYWAAFVLSGDWK